jgi:hypothetical protein
MDIASKVKRAPKWAWYTAGGLAIGVGGVRLWKNRTTADGEQPLPDSSGDSPVVMGPDPGSVYPGGNSPGVIVPPIIVPASGSEAGAGEGVTAGVGAVATLVDSIGSVVTPVVSGQADTIFSLITQQGQTINDTITGLLANAGSAPAPVLQNPTPVITPTAVAPAPAPKPPVTNPCAGTPYPYNSGTASRPDCFKKVCSDGSHTKDGTRTSLAPGLWHIHKDGRKVRMTTTKASCW